MKTMKKYRLLFQLYIQIIWIRYQEQNKSDEGIEQNQHY
ncbi:unnamed protein product [Paramecium octaurelia]|uniref:Uncharacterized protein n=1 Tax=Paramecium octaurelia TaxID=43137 RepID=A0A8S1UW85_PAROT|nr:unnamed protein product [Paramecium octaurelia]